MFMEETGSFSLTTDNNGRATHAANLTLYMASPLRQGDRVTFQAEYLTPALELVSDSEDLLVSFAPIMVGLKPSIPEPIPPGVSFEMFAVAQDILSGDFIPELSILLSVHEWDGEPVELNYPSGLISISTPSLRVRPHFRNLLSDHRHHDPCSCRLAQSHRDT